MSGTLVLCGAPIGDVRDASPRLGEILATADVIAAEDTRRVLRLAAGLGVTITGRIVSCYDAVEGARAAQLTEHLRRGDTVALVTDAGMPAVSDPGFRVVAAAAAAGMTVTVVPGPSAVTAALAVSGLPSDRWTFEGFLPRRGADRRTRLRELRTESRTMVFLDSPHRLEAGLRDLAAAFGPQRAAVLCRELTKTHQEIVRGDLAHLLTWATDGRVIRGEFTLVLAGAPRRPPPTILTGPPADVTVPADVTLPAPAGTAHRPGPDATDAGGTAGTDTATPTADAAARTDAAAGAAIAAMAGVGADLGSGDLGADVVEGETPPGQVETVRAEVLAADVERRAATGMSRKEARRAVAADYGLSRNDVYAAEIAARPAPPGRAADRDGPSGQQPRCSTSALPIAAHS
ncbi:16S rRNA (cytidine(1402)-2'-O)-methyltransferase [Candidatus Frankia nodulisporulans]|uniref:16S rRNA (cytidine(1402)-2'-O)-methyltransferase n=1 Tax=Candidatus Frankia nodulisporulans TaxID=2060052 RepID=UPI0013D1C798|nr:16S rRNA (cytidine(1402)-2'-O)-methyltransferase [Candidatus Frankia nodulisporulans]